MGPSVRVANIANMHRQLKMLWQNAEYYMTKYEYRWDPMWQRALVNNNVWLNKLGILDVLHVLGPGMRIGTMLGRDT